VAGLGVRAEAAQQRKAVVAGHGEILKDHAWAQLGGILEGLLGAFAMVEDHLALDLEEEAEDVGLNGVVIDEEDAHGGLGFYVVLDG
jgi:hypothetical protein